MNQKIILLKPISVIACILIFSLMLLSSCTYRTNECFTFTENYYNNMELVSHEMEYTLKSKNDMLYTENDFMHVVTIDSFGSLLELELSSPKVVNGMKRAMGENEYGVNTFGWICVVDFVEAQTNSLDEIMELELRFEATGEYSTTINLYSDEYRTEIIGLFIIIDFPYPFIQTILHDSEYGVMVENIFSFP